MRNWLRLATAPLLLLLLAASLAGAPAAAQSPPPSPVRPLGSPGSWYIGAIPPDFDPAKPVLVFVHGKGGSAAAWWSETAYHGPNDMYTYAYTHGYRTAFVDLEPEGDMWANGELLRLQLSQIARYFGVERVVVIAHSKGGVDVNAAAAFYGAGPLIEKVITLGSPHWGTPLADLAYSTWTWWLAALLGQNTDATYVMQTGYMAWFRSVADAAGDSVPYYTLSGHSCGPFLTALWWGCVYLSGEDDGAVPLAFSQKPGGMILAEGGWDHDEIRMGSRTWEQIESVLGADGSSVGAERAGTARPAVLTNLLLRGGEVAGAAAGQPFPIESGVRKVSIAFYASSPDFTATLTGPDGSRQRIKMAAPADHLFPGAWMGSVEIEKPAAGAWRFETAAPQRTGYLMAAALDSDLTARLELDRLVAEPGSALELAVSLSQEPAGLWVSVNGESHTGPQAVVTLPRQEGVQNLTVTVTGALADGTSFERTLVGSLAVVSQGRTGPWVGR